MRRVMLSSYAMEALRAEAPLHAASTPGVEAALAVGYSEPHSFALNGEQ